MKSGKEMEFISAYILTKTTAYVGGSILAFVLALIFKKIPNDIFSEKVEGFFHGLGKWCTLTASKKSKLWNTIIEPWLIDAIDNIIVSALKGFIRGLRSDNKK